MNMRKLKLLLMTMLCLVFATTVAFAAKSDGIQLQPPQTDVLSMHGVITEISADREMITITDKNNANQSVALIVKWNTKVLNGENGNKYNIDKLKVGDELTAYYSPIMTRSLPPQSVAYAIVVGDGQHDGIYTKVAQVEQTENGTRILNSNNDMLVTIPDSVNADAKNLKPGQKVLVWYDFVALSLPGQATATKAVIL